MIGRIGADFSSNRAKLLEQMGSSTSAVVSSYDKTREALQLSQEVFHPTPNCKCSVLLINAHVVCFRYKLLCTKQQHWKRQLWAWARWLQPL